MTDRPIIFSRPMVRALLEGRKTQTRRIMKEPIGLWKNDSHRKLVPIPWPYKPGDRLYVRENWRQAYPKTSYSAGIIYQSDRAASLGMDEYSDRHKWKPSIHLPKEHSRITLIVEAVKVERLQDISEKDAKDEGTELTEIIRGRQCWHASHRAAFAALWNSIHGPEAWDANPWVVAVPFKTLHGNIDSLKLEAP